MGAEVIIDKKRVKRRLQTTCKEFASCLQAGFDAKPAREALYFHRVYIDGMLAERQIANGWLVLCKRILRGANRFVKSKEERIYVFRSFIYLRNVTS